MVRVREERDPKNVVGVCEGSMDKFENVPCLLEFLKLKERTNPPASCRNQDVCFRYCPP